MLLEEVVSEESVLEGIVFTAIPSVVEFVFVMHILSYSLYSG